MTTLMNRSPWIEVPKHSDGMYRAAVLAKDWGSSYLYESANKKRVLLSKEEIPAREKDLIAVIGPLSQRALTEFLTAEVLE